LSFKNKIKQNKIIPNDRKFKRPNFNLYFSRYTTEIFEP
jgi:hypothetical protein